MTPDNAAISEVLGREGGRNDRIRLIDPGGPTNRGVTIATYSDFLGRAATEDELWRHRTPDARDLRLVHRADGHRGGEGPGRPRAGDRSRRAARASNGRRMLQRALGVADDGAIGPKTIAALGRPGRWRCACALAERAAFFGRHISGDLTDRDKDGILDATEFAKGSPRVRLADPLREIARRLS